MSRTRSEGKFLSSASSYTSSPEQSASEDTPFAITASQGEGLDEIQPLSGGVAEMGLAQARLPLFLGMDAAFSEANLPNGTDPDETLLTQSVEIPQGYSLSFDGDGRWSPNGDGEMVLQGEYGVFTASADGRSLRYTLTQPVINESDESDDDYFGYEQVNSLKLVDADGTVTSIPIQIEIEDDVPVATFTDSEGGYETGMKPGETMSGFWGLNFGADGKSEEHGGFEVRVYFGDIENGDYIADKLAPGANKGTFAIIKDGIYYGSLNFNTDGTYTFTAGPQEAQLYVGIGSQDSDGDISDMQGAGIALTISSSYVKPEIPALDEYEFPAITFDEANLSGGTAPDAGALVKDLALPDGYSVQVDDWESLGGGKYEKEFVGGIKLTYDDNSKKLESSLIENIYHGDEDVYDDDCYFTLVDGHGREVDAVLPVFVKDDAPELFFAGSGGEDKAALELGQSYTGKWGINFGADGPSDKNGGFEVRVYINGMDEDSFVSDQLAPKAGKSSMEVIHNDVYYGTLTFNADGTYTFLAAQQEATLHIGIGSSDSEGDERQTSGFTLNLSGGNTPEPPLEDIRFDQVVFDEAHLKTGTHPNSSAVSVDLPLPDGFMVSLEGWTDLGSGKYEIVTGGVRLLYDDHSYKLNCSLISAYTHGDEAALDLDALRITLVDGNGKTCNAYLPVKVQDDAPDLLFGGPSGEDKADLGLGEIYTGKWNVAFGADGPSEEHGGFEVRVYINEVSETSVIIDQLAPAAGKGSLAVIHNGVFYGTLTFNTDGTYSFQAAQQEAKLYIGIGTRDGDGDEVQTEGFTLNLSGGETPPLEDVRFEEVMFFEAHLTAGTDPNAEGVARQINIPDGFTVATEGWDNLGGGVYERMSGGIKLSYDSNANSLVCSMEQAFTHAAGQNELKLDDLSFTLQNADGQTCNAYLPVKVQDDAPGLLFGGPSGEDKADLGLGEVYTGKWNVAFGADGPSEEHGGFEVRVYVNEVSETSVIIDQLAPAAGKGSLAVIHNGVFYGTLTFNTDGTYSFQAAQQEAKLYIGIGTRDGDGDEVQTEGFTLNLSGGETPPLEEYTFDPVVFDEANLASGTAPDASAISKQLNLPSGYKVDTEGWTSVGSGKYELVENGVKLTYDSNGNTLVCSLEKALAHDADGKDSIDFDMPVFSLVDGNGNSCEAYLPVSVVDDIPEIAFSDINGKNEGFVEEGGTFTGAWNVQYGADGPGASGVVYLAITIEDSQNPLVQTLTPGSGAMGIDVVIDGVNYGKLTFNTDGTYTFKAQPDVQGTLYIALGGVQDGDGDTGYMDDDFGFTLTIGGDEPPVTIEDYYFDGLTFDEANYSLGSNPNPDAFEQKLTMPSGYTVVTEDWTALGDGQFEMAGEGYVLFYDSVLNSLSFILAGPALHNGQGRDSIELELPPFSIADANGNVREAYVPVTIIDDVPEASLTGIDGESSAALEVGESYTGRWDIHFGADGPADSNGGFVVQVYLQGNPEPFSQYVVPSLGASSVSVMIGDVYYGQLSFSKDGTYEFDARGDEKSAGTLIIGIGCQDGDGDEARSEGMTLTLTPSGSGSENVVFETVSFDEANLANGTSPDASSLLQQLELPAGSQIKTDGWTDLGGGKFELVNSIVKLIYDSAANTLSCSLESAFDHSNGKPEDGQGLLVDFVIVDADGATHNAFIPVSIKDDAPEASFAGPEGQTDITVTSGEGFTGNWDIVFGADGSDDSKGGFQLLVQVDGSDEIIPISVDTAFESTVVKVQIGGTYYGTISFHPDGTYDFDSTNGAEGTLYISIAGQDSDGDINGSDRITLTIKDEGIIEPGEPIVLGNVNFDEANLANGTNPDQAALTQVIFLPPGYGLVTEGWKALGDGRFELGGDATDGYFRFFYDGETLTCTLLQSNWHGGQEVANAWLSTLKLVGPDGTEHSTLLPVNLKDDQPVLEVDQPELGADGVYSSTWDVHFGADGPTVFPGLRVTVELPDSGVSQTFEFLPGHGPIAVFADNVFYGLLRFDNDGSYSFTPTDKCTGKVNLTVSVWDDDTSVISENVSIAIGDEPVPPGGIEFPTIILDEANLPNGTSPDASALTKWLEVPDGWSVNTEGWTDLGDGVFGLESNGVRLVYDGSSLSCLLSGSLQHSGQGRDSIDFTMPAFQITDPDGKVHEGKVPVKVIDDMPEASFAGPDGESVGTVPSGGSYTGQWNMKFGADGATEEHGGFEIRVYIGEVSEAALISDRLAVPAKPNLAIIHEGKYYGMLTFTEDGAYTFQAAPDTDVTLYIGIGSMDVDGDIAESSGFTLNVGSGSAPSYLGMGVTFDEANLPDGTAHDAALLSKAITLPQGYVLDVTQDGWSRNADGSYSRAGEQGTLVASADGTSLSYVLEKAAGQDGNTGHDVISGIKLVDADGKDVYLDAKIEIADDKPFVEMQTAPGTPNTIEPGGVSMGLLYGEFGADGPNAESAYQLQATVNGQSIILEMSIGKENAVDVMINGVNYGKIYLEYIEPHGMAYAYQSNPDMPPVGSINFAIGLTDSDGDTVFANNGQGVTVQFDVDDPLPALHLEFNEANMPGGTAEDATALTQTFTLPNRYVLYTEGWPEEDGKLISETAHGLIVYDPVTNSVSYTLYRVYTHPEDGRDSLDFTDHLTLMDSTGNTFEWTFPVTVTDDTPEVSFAPNGGADILENGGTLAGAWDVQYGADGASSLQLRVDSPNIDDSFVYQVRFGASNDPIVVELGGRTIGTLALNDNGTFSFKASPGVSGQFSFKLEATDGDQDTVAESFTVNVLAEGVNIPYLGYGTTFNEAHLPDGTAPDAEALMRYFELPAGYRVDVTDGWHDLGNGMLVKQGAKGYLACSADGTEIGYRLDLAVSNNGMDYIEHDGNMAFDVIRDIKLIGQDNSVIYMDAKAAIMDDVPVVEFGGDNSNAIVRGEDFVGEWSGYFGADGPASENSMLLNVSLDGVRSSFAISVGEAGAAEIIIGGVNYGRLVLVNDGTFVYQSSSDMPLTDSIGFSLTLTDGDGDRAYPNDGEDFVLQIRGTAPAPSIVLDVFNEANLLNGTDPNVAALTKTFELPAGYEIVLDDWELSGNRYIMETKDGYFSYEPASDKIRFTLTGPVTHAKQGNDELALDIGRIQVQDSNGELTSIKVSTTVVDDAPILEFVEGGNAILGSYQGFTTSGVLVLEFGADGVGEGLTFPLTLEYSYTNGGQPVDGSTTLDVPMNGARTYFDTAMGRGMVYYDAEQGKVFYEYEALRGSRSDSESLTLSVTDADGDVVSADMTMTLDTQVPFVITLDEAGLPNGSGGIENGAAMNSADMDPAQVNSGVTAIEWDTAKIGISSADGNMDGKYDNVIWKQSGNNLCGYANGELVLEVVPEFYKGAFTGGMSAILHKPFDHSGSNGTLSLNLGFSQVSENGSGTPGNVTVAIKDDVPFANAGKDTVITLMDDADHKTDAVYLVVDTTLSTGYMYKQIEAIRALVQEYKATSPNVEFTLIPFGGGTHSAEVRMDSVGADELLARLTPDVSGRSFLKGNLSAGTDYTVALETTMNAIQSDMSRPGSQSSTVYFMTDGVQSLHRDEFINSWSAFRDSTPDMEVYALGVGTGFTKQTSSGMYPLIHITGDASHVTGIPNFNNVHEALTGLYKPSYENNLLDGHGSADLTTISSIVLGEGHNAVTYTLKDTGDASGLKNTGHIPLENGATLVVYENGEYNVFGYEKLTNDYESSIKLTFKDADGSLQVTDVMSFVVKETVPVAHDKLSSYSPGYEQTSLFGSFESAGISKAEGWTSYNASWSTYLPAAMEAFPSESLLNPYMGAKSICLTAGSMSAARVGDFIGKSVSFSGVLEDLGITSSKYINDSGTSGAAMTSKSFSSKGGEIVFNWSFSGSGYGDESDAAFWMLLDAKGNLVDSGALAHFEHSSGKLDYESGVTRVQVPDSATSQDYKLVIGSVDAGNSNASNASRATLYVNAAVVTDGKYHFSGNVLTDPAQDGSMDVVYGGTVIEGVDYNGQIYTFNSLGVLTIKMGSGTFVMDRSGAYTLKLHEGADFTLVDEELNYVLVDGHNNRDVATLSLKGEPAYAYDNIATVEHRAANLPGVGKFEYHFKGNVMEDPSVDGQVDVSFDNTHLASINYDGQTRYFSESEQVQVFTNSTGKLVVDWNGNYYFTSASGEANGVSEQFNYTLTQGASGNSGNVTIRAHGPQVYDLVGSHIDTETKAELVNGSTGWNNLTGGLNARFAYTVNGLPEFPDIIADHMDSVYARNYGYGSINPVLSQIMGNTKGSFADLLEMCGVEGNVYRPEDPQGSFMSTTVKSSGGAIVFDWLMGVDQYADSREMDAAIWVLRDDSNRIISSGTLAQLKTGEHSGSVKASTGNVGVIPLPPTMEEKEYTLVVGTVQVGRDVGHVANFLVDAVVNVEQGFQFKGNVFEDTSETGQKASTSTGSLLGMVAYKGTEYMMDESGLITIKTESGGTMYFMYDGTYAYVDADGRDGSYVFEDFDFTVVDGENLYDTATLSLRGDQFRFTGTDHNDVIDHSQYTTPDIVNAGAGDDVVYGGRGNENIHGGDGNDTIYANAGNDRVYGGNGDDELHGGAGNDTLYGGSGNDLIFGDDGNDLLYGGSGNNTLWGGSGADTFAWKHQTDLIGKDVIMDFSVSEGDKLKFDQLLDLDDDPQSFFRSHFANLNLDTKTDEFSFTYKDGMYAKDIELHFDASTDAGYQVVKDAFVSTTDLMQQQEILAEFLSTLAS